MLGAIPAGNNANALQIANGKLFVCARGQVDVHELSAPWNKLGSLVTGGYKAMRQFLMNNLDTLAQESSFLLLSGYTGSGKTSLLTQMSGVIDLEELAKHRGSAFGERVCGQPSQIDFENQLSIALLKQTTAAPNASVWLEDEGDFIGSVAIPNSLRLAMKRSPMVVLDCSLEERVDHTFDEYVRKLHLDFCVQYGADGDRRYADFMRERLARIQRRLGGTRYQALLAQLEQGLLDWLERRGEEPFRVWLEAMLQGYYDPMYRYQLEQKKEYVLFQGDSHAILEWAVNRKALVV